MGKIDWSKHPLGKVNDCELARRLGCSRAVVRYARVSRGIAPAVEPPRSKYDWVDWNAQPMGVISDLEIGRRLGIPGSIVYGERRRRGIPAYQEPLGIDWDTVGLGTKTDRAIAEELGCCQASVSSKRRKRGIKPFGQALEELPKGLMTSSQAADLMRVSYMTLSRWRSLGLGPKYRRERGRVIYRRCDVHRWIKRRQAP